MPTPVIAFGVGTNFADPITTSVDVGTASNRAAYVLLGRNNSSTPSPVAVTVGTDSLTAQGSVFTASDGRKWQLFAGALTVTGTQTVSGDYDSSAGFAYMLGMVLQDVDTGVISGVVYDDSNTSTDPPSYTVTSNTSSSVYAMFLDVSGLLRTLTPSSPATQLTGTGIAGTTGFHIMEEAGTSSVTIDGTFSASATWRGAAFSVPGVTPPATLSGEAILAGITADGSMAPLPDSSIAGEAILAGITADGGMGLAPGVLTTPVLKNNTGTILASVSGIVANIYHPTTGALVVRKTGLSSNGSGIVTISDVLLAAGTTYAYELDLSATTQGRRLPTGVAA